jgi:hypothetical protein
VILAILIVGAASSRDHAMNSYRTTFFAAGSRSHEKSRYFGLVSYKQRLWPRASSLIEKETKGNVILFF